jgi:hypothetical protein
MNGDDITTRVENLEKAQEVQAATQAGAQATQAAAFGGTWAAMIAGSVALVVGMLLGAVFRKN